MSAFEDFAATRAAREAEGEVARAAIDALQEAHEKQLTRMAKERARLQRKVERLEARVAELESAGCPQRRASCSGLASKEPQP